ncbi:MAG TPA: holo-[acyl-carrier-protein] synthase [Dehalococcoidia bacterium]|nr:holo-[acyl-carrier-protein] synthase [Dehalococcoidia bacterium]
MLINGVDIIEIARIRKMVKRWGKRFLDRIYTDIELRICNGKPERLASRFAGKEAVMKALGTGARGISWREIEIASETSGKPVVNLYGKARAKAESIGLNELAISLSDSREYSVAFVIGELKSD